jgi:hypothetical protein
VGLPRRQPSPGDLTAMAIPVPTTTARRTLSRQTVLACSAAAALLVVSTLSIYVRSFSGFSDWDDDGYVMAGIRSLLHGHPLYNQAHAIYGPFFYLIQYMIHKAFHVPVTHDAVRWTVGTFWLLSALLCSWVVRQQTRSWWLTAVGFGLAMTLLKFFTLSAGHPEEVCMILLLATLAAVVELREKDTAVNRCLLGGLIGALLMTKTNIGVFASLSVFLILTKALRSGWAQKIWYIAGSMAGIALPFLIMAPLLHFVWASRISIYLALSLAAGILAGWRCRIDSWVSRRLWVTLAISCACVAVISSAFFLMQGTTLGAMLNSTIWQNRESIKNWYVPLQVRTERWAAAAFLLAALWAALPEKSALRPHGIRCLNLLKGILVLLWFWAYFKFRYSLYELILPFCWLVLVPVNAAGAAAGTKQQFRRLALCMMALFTGLYPLPVAGAQIQFSAVLTLPVICTFINDTAAELLAWKIPHQRIRILKAALALVLGAGYVAYLRNSIKEYRQLTPLGLPGAERVRTTAAQVTEYQWIAQQLTKPSCDSYFSMPGIFSLYFWTKTEPPTLALMSNWIGLFNASQQEGIVQDLSRINKMCIVYNPRLVEFWRRGQDMTASPLARYIRDQFRLLAAYDDYSVLVRR